MSIEPPPPQKVPLYRIDKIIGCYHPLYDRKIHGPYNPGTNYSAANDIHWSKVKLRDLPSWMKRRDFSITNVANGVGRVFFRFENNHFMPVRAKANAFFSMLAVMALVNAVLVYKTNSK